LSRSPWSPKLLILSVAIGGILRTHSRDALPRLERSLAGVVMKFLALGFGLLGVLLVSLRVFRMVQFDTGRTQTAEVSSLTASPKMPPQPASGPGLDLPAGTVVSVTLADPIDSDHDPSGKQYAASVKTVEGRTIAPGSIATVGLLRNNTGLLTQLTGLTIHGRKFQVFSGAGSVVATQQDSQASPSHGMFEQASFAPATKPALDQRILLPPATQLRFVLIRGTTPARAHTASPRYTPEARMVTDPGLSPAASTAGAAYLCSASDTPGDLPTFYYIAHGFRISDSQALVERRWHEFLVATYPYRFADNHHMTAQCNRLTDHG
jgi:hypothetical protein